MDKTLTDVYGLLEKVVLKLDEHDRQFERIEMRFQRIEARFVQIESRFEQIDARFEQMEFRFKQIDARFEQMESRFEQIDVRFEQMDSRFEQIDARFEQTEKQWSNQGRRLNSIEEMGARLITMAADNHAGLQEVHRRLERIEVDLSELKAISDSNRCHTSFLDKKVWDNEKELFLLRERVEQLHAHKEKEAEED
ncbi:hypothetical protein [Brevibacillus migulae]|uniref:hypothetical protein n=1 Tax=Brevibacillus migulae TaxID=1644114 RepID=UPI00106E2139|nr:hypothetical protein [Brevibacillus migulae]